MTCVDAETDWSVVETACICTVEGVGTEEGAVYTPELVIVPRVALPPATPFTSQVTPVLVVLATVAVNVCVPVPACTLPLVGQTATITTGFAAQVVAVALLGAVEVAESGLRTTWALSTEPALSVTETCTVASPHEGAVTVAIAPVPPAILTLWVPTLVH
jgi:hypothetical protein